VGEAAPSGGSVDESMDREYSESVSCRLVCIAVAKNHL